MDMCREALQRLHDAVKSETEDGRPRKHSPAVVMALVHARRVLKRPVPNEKETT